MKEMRTEKRAPSKDEVRKGIDLYRSVQRLKRSLRLWGVTAKVVGIEKDEDGLVLVMQRSRTH